MDGPGRLPGLDGLRGIAILLVILDHGNLGPFGQAGGVGVAVFFVLSGYLITGLLLAERERTGRVSVRGFYGRRARRLLPALVLMLAVTLVVFGSVAVPSVLASLFYVANVPASTSGSDLFYPLHHMWSLSVEEQFYLLWPACLLGLLAVAGRRVGWLVAGLAAVGVMARLGGFVVWGFHWAYHATLPNAFPLLVGAAVAVVCAGRRWRPSWPLGAAGAALLLAVAVVPLPSDGWVMVRTSVAVLAVVPLLRWDAAWLRFGPLRYCGRVSYGWYLWHVLFQLSMGGLVGSVVSFAVASLSWHGWESRWVARPASSGRLPAVELATAEPA